MKNVLWKFVSIVLVTANITVFLTFIARLFPQLGFVIFILSAVAIAVLLFFYPDIQEEDGLTKGIVLAAIACALVIGWWDFITVFVSTNQTKILEILQITGIVVLVGTVGILKYALDKRARD